LRTILDLSDHVAERLRQDDYRARKVTLKLRYSSFSTHTKQHSLDKMVQTGEEIAAVARRLFSHFPLKQKIRLIGVAAGDLHRDGEQPQQLQLFAGSIAKRKKAQPNVDRSAKFGSHAVRRGSQLLMADEKRQNTQKPKEISSRDGDLF
jgi:DNA polymerase-4